MNIGDRSSAVELWLRVRRPALILLLVFLALATLVQFTFPGLEPVSEQHRSAIPMIHVPAGRTVAVEFESFCLDHHRGGPRSGSSYSMMGKTAGQLRPYVGQIFNEYLNHPSRWAQGDVQAGIWYCEGETNWEGMTPSQRKLIETATGQIDPAHKHPLILINTLYERLSLRGLLESGIYLLLTVVIAACLATAKPSGLLVSVLEWMGAMQWADRVRKHRYAGRVDDLARIRELGVVRDQADALLRAACRRIVEWRSGKGRST